MSNDQAVNATAAKKDDILNLEIFCHLQVVVYTWALSALILSLSPSLHGSCALLLNHHVSLMFQTIMGTPFVHFH